jgi:ribose 1,5-bisphosphate isomerase
MNKKRIFYEILNDIKNVRIQGARNIAKKALYAYSLVPTKKSENLLLSARPTEPMLARVLEEVKRKPYQAVLAHFDSSQKIINKNVLKLVRNKDIIFTHCHSTNVINALKYAATHGKRFEIYNTETRPLFQGRITAKELKNAGIKVTMFVDSAAMAAIKESDKIFIGADALLKEGIINKIGSGMFARIAHDNHISVYIIADSWKFTNSKVPIENRNLNEIWDKAPKNVKIKNPAFEFVPKKYITGIISEIGILKYDDFVRRMKKS